MSLRLQEIRRFKPSAVSRRFSAAAGCYRTCVLNGVLQHSPAEHLRRPAVPAESPTLEFTHLQFEAPLPAARESANPHDFALVAMLGLPGLRIFEATAADIADLGEEHGHRCCGCAARAPRSSWSRSRQRPAGPSTGQHAPGLGEPILLNSHSTRMDRHAATRRLRHLAETASIQVTRAHPHMLRHTSRPCSTQAWISETSRSPPATPTRAPRCGTTGHAKNLDRHPNYILAAYMASGT